MKTKFKDFSLNENTMNIIELANLTNKMDLDNEVVLKILREELKNNGDKGLIKKYKEITGINIEALGEGKYIFKNN